MYRAMTLDTITLTTSPASRYMSFISMGGHRSVTFDAALSLEDRMRLSVALSSPESTSSYSLQCNLGVSTSIEAAYSILIVLFSCRNDCLLRMVNKRKQPDSNPSDTLFTSKRSRPNQVDGRDDVPNAAQARIDPTYGQRGAFPGLDDPAGEDELFYGPANDGMEYLRMVR